MYIVYYSRYQERKLIKSKTKVEKEEKKEQKNRKRRKTQKQAEVD